MAGPGGRPALVGEAVKLRSGIVSELELRQSCPEAEAEREALLNIVKVSPGRTLAFCAPSRLIEKVAALQCNHSTAG
jgi:hypothetical protein